MSSLYVYIFVIVYTASTHTYLFNINIMMLRVSLCMCVSVSICMGGLGDDDITIQPINIYLPIYLYNFWMPHSFCHSLSLFLLRHSAHSINTQND